MIPQPTLRGVSAEYQKAAQPARLSLQEALELAHRRPTGDGWVGLPVCLDVLSYSALNGGQC